MDGQVLKDAIKGDIETLKTLDLEIMPSKDYYRANFKLFGSIVLKIYLTILFAVLCSLFLHGSNFFSDRFALFDPTFLILVGPVGFSLFIFLFIHAAANNYVIFYYQMRSKLKTGELINQQIKQAAWLSYAIFSIGVILPALFVTPGSVLIAGGVSFIATAILTGLLVEMEMKRVGVSTLFTLIQQYFEKNKNEIELSKGK